MKRIFAICLILGLCIAPGIVLPEEALPLVGVCIYNGEDTFMSSLLDVILAEAQDVATLIVCDAQNDQNRQNDQVEALLKAGLDALIVNPVDRTTAIYQLQMAMRYQAPIVFINREPLLEDLALYDKAYYVGIDPKEQGELSGQLAGRYFLEHPSADKNGDGVMQIVLLKGEPGHQDAEHRTQSSLKAILSSGVALELLGQGTGMWERSQGQEKMAGFLNAFGDRIECVLCNNDDMALGVIDALKAAGYFSSGRFMPVLGIDATAPALEALKAGTLYGTVMNDAREQGRAVFELALLLSSGETVTEENFPYDMQGKVVYVNSRVVTLQTLEDGE